MITPLSFAPGRLQDYALLSHLHYRPRPPATCVHVITARAPRCADPVGVLVVSMPVLNAAWRDVVFPDRYRSGDRRADALRLNAEVRTISRVVVDPRYRGLGVASSLVRRYLRASLTPVTEAVGVMGMFSGFFEAAGMTRVPVVPSHRDLRLADALAALGVEPCLLADPSRLAPHILGAPLLQRELRRWAQHSRATRRAAGAGVLSLLRLAARIFHPPAVFVAVRTTQGVVHDQTTLQAIPAFAQASPTSRAPLSPSAAPRARAIG